MLFQKRLELSRVLSYYCVHVNLRKRVSSFFCRASPVPFVKMTADQWQKKKTQAQLPNSSLASPVGKWTRLNHLIMAPEQTESVDGSSMCE